MKNIIAAGIILLTMTAFCRPHYKHHRHKPVTRHHIHRHHIHRSPHHIHRHHTHRHYVGPFVGALTGTIVGNILTVPNAPIVVQQPATVVQTPVIIQQPRKIWVPGQYISQVQPNGTVIKVWQSGYWQIIE